MNYLDQLNEVQREAVEHKDGPLLIIAGAGAGKTRTVTYRIRHLINQAIKPKNILAITFTNKAAREMKERLEKLLQNNDEKSTERHNSGNEVWVGTFHAFGVYILRAHSQAFGLSKFFSIFDRDESITKIKEAMRSIGIDEKRFEPRKVLNAISRQKGDGINFSEYQNNASDFFQKTIAGVWSKYEILLKKEGALDFDDLLIKTVELFKTRPDILASYQERFHYIHVDEYQDTNVVQYELVKLLAEKYKNICVVGDMDQSIYGWRGADYTNLLRFEKDYPNTKTVLLEENYRSTQTILTAANQVITKNTKRFEKNLFTKNKAGSKISLFAGLDESEEARFIARRAKELIEEGKQPSEISVLYRANFQSRILEEAFLRESVPYQVLGTRFFERKEIKDVVAFIKSALNPNDFESLKRIINIPPRGIGKTTLAKMALGQEESLPAKTREKIHHFRKTLNLIAEFADQNKPSVLIKFILDKTGIEDLLKKGGEDDAERLENLKEFVSLATKYDSLPTEEGIPMLLTEIALATDQDSLNQNKNGAKLMTVHASKGLEFDCVFIAGLEQDLFPHAGLGNEKRDDEEERRLFYVAVTRAREKLFLTYAQSRLIFGSRQVNMPSEFIFDIDEELVENDDGLWTII